MADIARLGFDVDSAPLARGTAELRNLTTAATTAQTAASALGTVVSRSFLQIANDAGNANRAITSIASSFTVITAGISAANTALANLSNSINSTASAMAALAQANARVSASHTAVAGTASQVIASNSQILASQSNVANMASQIINANSRLNASNLTTSNTANQAANSNNLLHASNTALVNSINQVAAANTQATASHTNVANAARSSAAANSQVTAANAAQANSARNAANSNDALVGGLSMLRAGYAALAAVIFSQVVQAISKAIDTSIQFSNSLYLAGTSGAELTKTMNDLYDIANKTGQGIDDIQLLYRRASTAAKSLGMSNQEVENTVLGVASALKIQGTNARQAQGVLLQFTQAMGSGTVRAEEFNSIMEGAQPIAQAAARGWAGGAISVGDLRNKMLAGSVTSKQFVDALAKGFGVTIEQAKQMGFTIEQSTTIAHNGFVRLAGAIAEVTQLTSGLASAFGGVSDALSDAAKWIENLTERDIQEFISRSTAALVVFGTAITVMCIPAIISLGATVVTTMAAITVAILANPIGLLIVAVTAVVVAMYYFRDETKAVFAYVGGLITDAVAVIGDALGAANDWLKSTFGIDIIAGLKDAVQWIKETFGIDLPQIFSDFGDWMANIFGSGDIVEITKTVANKIIRTFINMWNDIKFVWNNFKDLSAETWDSVVSYAASVINPFVVKAITWFNDMMVKVTGIWNNLGTIVWEAIDTAIDNVVTTIQNFVKWGKKEVIDFADKVSYVWTHFPEIMGNVLAAITTFVSTAFDKLVNWLLGKFSSVMEWGKKVKDWFVSLMTTPAGAPFQLSVPPEIKAPPPDPERDARLAAARAAADQIRIQTDMQNYVDATGNSYEKTTAKTNKNTDAVSKNTAAAAKHKALDPYTKIITDAQQLIDKQAILESQLGKTEVEMLQATYTQELFNKAQDANLKLSEPQRKKIEELGAAYAKAKSQFDAAKEIYDFKKRGEEAVQASEAEAKAVTMSTAAGMAYIEAQKEINSLQAKGIVLRRDQIDSINATAEATANAKVETERYVSVIKTIKEAGKDALKGLLADLRAGKDFWTAFADAATKAINKIIDKLEDIAIDKLFDSLSGKGSAGGSSGSASSSSSTSFFGKLFDGIGNFFSSSSSSSGGKGFFSGISDSISNFFSSSPAISSVPTSPDVMGPIQAQPAGFFNFEAGTTMGSFGMSNALGGVSALLGGFKAITAKNTKDTIAGIGQAIGGVLMMIPTPWTMAAGMVISLASSILPGLLGLDQKQTETSYGYDAIRYDATSKGFVGAGSGAWGPNWQNMSMQGPMLEMSKNMVAVFDKFTNGVVDAAKVWGLEVKTKFEKFSNDQTNTTIDTNIVGPDGQRIFIGSGQDTPQGGAIAATIQSIIEGAVGPISDSLKTAMTNFRNTSQQVFPITFDGLVKAIDFVRDAYDTLSKTASAIKIISDLKTLNDTFKAIEKGAEALGLSLDPVKAGFKKAREDYAKAFMDPFLLLTDPVGQALKDFALAATESRTALQELINEGLASATDLATVNNALLIKEAELKENLYGVTVKQLQDAIQQLTTGDLSNATSATAFAAAKSAFDKTAQEAALGDAAATARVVQEGLDLAELGRQQFGSGVQYENLKVTIEDIFESIRDQISAVTSTNPPESPATSTVDPQLAMAYNKIDQLTDTINSQNDQIIVLMKKVTDLVDLLQRTATNR